MILKREMEYTYTIELPENWNEEAEGRYSSESPWARLSITSMRLPAERGLNQFRQSVQDGLRGNWWPDASLFEITSVEEVQIENHSAERIRYRVQEAPQYCVVDVEEVLVISEILTRFPQGFRVRTWMCENDVANHGQVRTSILRSFQVGTRPAEYYTQFVPVKGVMVKAHQSVAPAALQAGAEIVDGLLSGREDIAECMPLRGADLAIIPRDQTNVDLPEFAHLKGTSDFTGRRRDTFEIRGLGGVAGQPVSSAGEEQLLGNRGPEHPWMPYRGLAAAHEYAHAIQNVCFKQQDHDRWNKFYEEASETGLYPGSHMMADVHEFFAVLSTVYFEVTNELHGVRTREELAETYPMIFQALDDIYAGATLDEKFRTLIRP